MSTGNGTAVSSLSAMHLSAQQRETQRAAMIAQINATTVNVQALLRAVGELQAERETFHARTGWQRLRWLLTGD